MQGKLNQQIQGDCNHAHFLFLENFSDNNYPSASFEWIQSHAANIARISALSGVSPGVIAGIMAEEHKDYLESQTVNELSDLRVKLHTHTTKIQIFKSHHPINQIRS